MPELLLPTLSGKELASNNKAKSMDISSSKVEASDKKDSFTNVLSSAVNRSDSDKKSLEEQRLEKSSASLKPENKVPDELASSLQTLSEELSKIDSDLDELSDLKSFINGHDLTSQYLDEEQLGLSLPEFLEQLQMKLADLKNALSEQEGMASGELAGLERSLSQLGFVINDALDKTKVNKPNVLLGGGGANGTGINGVNVEQGAQWQRYDSQPFSQNTQISGDGSIGDQLVPKTDRDFQLQMEQLVSEKTLNMSDKSDTLVDTLLEGKDKVAAKFSDLQLKTPVDGLKPYSTTLSTSVNSQGWGDELNQKVVWFSGRNISAAEMHLNPAELGPIDVKISVQNDVASLTFNVSNSSVKDLLESNVVRLREMMEASGVEVGEVNIDSGSKEHSDREDSENNNMRFSGAEGELSELGDEAIEQTITMKETNLVDYFV